MYWFSNFLILVSDNTIQLSNSITIELNPYIKYIKRTNSSSKYFHIIGNKLVRYEKYHPDYMITVYDDGKIISDTENYRLKIINLGNRLLYDVHKTYYVDINSI